MRKKLHSLKKIKVRQDWSRWTLYNLSRLAVPPAAEKTFFQQKWAAKSLTRAYHGEQVREKQWKRMFRRNIPAVVPMDHAYLARHDGSEQAAGRGSGADVRTKQRQLPSTPYMHMTYYPIERRLDTAVWRALFASSTRQARQFVVHGWVKVNGKKIIYPGYLLNPGDMFQVDPERVLYATGAKKITTRKRRRIARIRASQPKKRAPSRATKASKSPELISVNDQSAARKEAWAPRPELMKERLLALMEEAKAALAENKDKSAKDKQNLRSFKRAVRRAISVYKGETSESLKTLEDQLSFIKSRYTSVSSGTEAGSEGLNREEEKVLAEAFQRIREHNEARSDENPEDPSKPYATPWRPREYMSAFAFIPRYLEVNQNVCAAVYLRHPVVRPGLAEVPTPFPIETSQLAFNWYLRRR